MAEQMQRSEEAEGEADQLCGWVWIEEHQKSQMQTFGTKGQGLVDLHRYLRREPAAPLVAEAEVWGKGRAEWRKRERGKKGDGVAEVA